MRFAHLMVNERRRLGVRRGDEYVLLNASWPYEIGAFLRSGIDPQSLEKAFDSADTTIAVHDAVYAPMVADGAKILCLGLNYVDHAAEANMARPAHPVIFVRYASSFAGHDQPLIAPSISICFDYEAELAVMIGRPGRHISKDKALDYVAGYTLLNDGTIRDFQWQSSQWTMGKNFDASGAVGPELVTRDELPEGAAGLSIHGKLNEEIMQRGNTSDMIFDVATSITYISQAIKLEPGDLIALGTPSGVGMARSPQVWLKPGDTFEVCIEKIGTLRNMVRPEIR